MKMSRRAGCLSPTMDPGCAIERFTKSIESQKEIAAAELRSVMNHLSKKELGEAAYSLVKLASRKRSYSSELEAEGGPAAFAILTPTMAFSWLKGWGTSKVS